MYWTKLFFLLPLDNEEKSLKHFKKRKQELCSRQELAENLEITNTNPYFDNSLPENNVKKERKSIKEEVVTKLLQNNVKKEWKRSKEKIHKPIFGPKIPKKVHECSHCDFACVNQKFLKRHLSLVHSDKKPFKCESCSKTFWQEINLNSHINKSHQKKVFICDVCAAGFSSESNLKHHLGL